MDQVRRLPLNRENALNGRRGKVDLFGSRSRRQQRKNTTAEIRRMLPPKEAPTMTPIDALLFACANVEAGDAVVGAAILLLRLVDSITL